MSKISTVYDNECLNCGKKNRNFTYHEYCDSSCETSHQYKLEEKAEKKAEKKAKKKCYLIDCNQLMINCNQSMINYN